ncbi:MAG: nuclear transport factor 2 family protein [Actinobacteria bacterium]|nr:nuclear transport factor 2 family protein [Actinomycetota bacterium]
MSDPSLLRQLLDRQEIMDVMAAYTRCADLNQPEQQAETFIEDCRVRYHLTGWIIGRKALVEALHKALASYSKTSHHLSNIEIEFEGPDSAAAQSAVIAWHRRKDGSEWTLYGRYVDRWTRTEQGWRLAERELRAAGAVGRDDSQLPPIGRADGPPR